MGISLSQEDVECLLNTNKMLRRLHDNTVGAQISKFDWEFMPSEGWQTYFERVEMLD